MMPFSKALMTAIACCAFAGSAFAQIRFAQNSIGQTTELTGLFRDPSCPSTVDVSGRVVKREFADDAVTVNGFVVERADGTRQFVNVEVPRDLDMATQSIVYDGLQRLLQQDRQIQGQAVGCGAAGRVLSLERVR